MSGSRFVLPYQSVWDAAGVPYPGALLYFYVSESDTPAPTYSNPELTTANANPVEADAGGQFPSIFLNPDISYKVKLFKVVNGVEVEVWTADPVCACGGGGSEVNNGYIVNAAWIDAWPADGQIIGMHTIPLGLEVTFPAELDTAAGYCADPVGVETVIQIEDEDGTVLGHVTIAATTGDVTFDSTDDEAFTLSGGSTIIFRTDSVTSGGTLNATWSLLGSVV